MNNDRQKTTMNLVAVMTTQLLSWALTLLVLKFVPTYLKGKGYADWSTAVAIPAAFASLVNLGISSVLVREVSKNPERSRTLLVAALAARVPPMILSFAAGTLLARGLGYPKETIHLVMLAYSWLPLVQANDAINSILQGLGDFKSTSKALFAERLATSLLSIGLVFIKAPLILFALVAAIGAALNVAITATALARHGHLSTTDRHGWRTDPSVIRMLVIAGFPLMSGMVFHGLWEPVARLLISGIAEHVSVAWYDLAKRLNGTALFLPAAMTAVLMPQLSRSHVDDPEAFVRTARRLIQITVLAAAPIAVVLSFGAHRIIRLLGYPADFDGTIPALRLMGAATGVWFLSQATGTILLASERQAVIGRLCMRLGILILPVSGLGIWLGYRIPWIANGAVGAIAADAILESTLLLGYIRALPDRVFTVKDLTIIPRTLLAAVPLAAAAFWMRDIWHALLLAPAFLAYVGLCVALRCLSSTDVTAFRTVFQSFLNKRTAAA